MNTKAKRIVFFGVLVVVAVLIWEVVQSPPDSTKATYSKFLQQVQSGEVSKAIVVAAHTGATPVTYSLKDGARMRTVLPRDYRDALEAMRQKMVEIEIRDPSSQWLRVVANASPFLLLLGFWFFMMGRMPTRDAK